MIYKEVISSALKSVNNLPRFFSCAWSVYRSDEKARSLPFRLQIENSTICNLSCQMCPLKEMKRAKGMMKFSVFQRIFDEIRPGYLNLTGYGESFLNPDILKMVTHAKKFKTYVKFDTNGTVLNRKRMIEILDSGLDLISFSIDAADRKTYLKIRQADQFEKVIDNLRLLVERRDSLKKTLKIHAAIVVQEDNLKDLIKFIKLMDQIGVDKVNPTPVIEYDISQNKKYKIDKYRKMIRELLSEYYKISKTLRIDCDVFPLERFLSDKNDTVPKNRNCFVPWYSSYIAWNGDVFPCCYYYDGQITFGNIFRQSFREIWNSNRYQDFRRKLLQTRDKLPICSSCELNEKFILEKIQHLKVPLLGMFTKR